MKKIWSYLTAVLLAFGFTACEDVPAPYEINDGGDTEIPGMDDILLDEDFSATLGSFQSVSKVGNFPWAVSYGCAQVTSYQDTDGDGQKDRIYASYRKFFRENPDWSLFMITTDKDVEEKIFGREADRRRKLYNGRLEVCYYQFHGTKPSRKEKSDEKM